MCEPQIIYPFNTLTYVAIDLKHSLSISDQSFRYFTLIEFTDFKKTEKMFTRLQNLGNLAGVVFGVFMYFPTLVEVPIAKMFLSLGMHRGPLIAYLMADPELSLQSILVTATIIGKKKA